MARGFYARTGTYSLQLAEFAKRAGARANAVVRKVVIDIGARIVARSPVGDASLWKHPAPKGYAGGRFRANWQYGNFSSGGIPVGEVSGIDPSGAETVARIASQVPQAAAGMRHLIVNNLPYAQRLEDGWSRQAPNGMVFLTVLEYQDIVRRAAGEARQA